MKVKDLIGLLQKCDAELDVFVAYDIMVCRHDIGPEDIAVIEQSAATDDWESGVYFCAGTAELEWNIKEAENRMPGHWIT